MGYKLNVEYRDLCLPCYVLDHCNGENECLIGVPVYGNTTYEEIREALKAEIVVHGYLPEGMSDQTIIDAIDAYFASADSTKVIDPSLDPFMENEDNVLMWFRFSWRI